MSENNSSGEVILAVLLGGIIGAALGVLFAPSSGKETRRRIRILSQDVADEIQEFGSEMKEKAAKIIDEGKERLMESKERAEHAFEAGRKAYEKRTP